MPDTTFTAPEWRDTLTQAGYTDFDSWWNAKINLVEVGNFRGPDANTSWSHVSRIELPDGRTVYLKRQQNHFPNNLILKARKISTFEIEWKNYKSLQSAGVPTMKIVHFASRKQGNDRQCLIVSEELKEMSSIHELIKWYEQNTWPARKERLAMLAAIVKIIKILHAAGLSHNALYSRHIYLNIPFINDRPTMPETFNACLIDLERTKSSGKNDLKLITNDLEKMYRRIHQWPARDCLWFLKQYLGITKLTPKAKEIVKKIASTRQLKNK